MTPQIRLSLLVHEARARGNTEVTVPIADLEYVLSEARDASVMRRRANDSGPWRVNGQPDG